jgi:hypothetical protein
LPSERPARPSRRSSRRSSRSRTARAVYQLQRIGNAWTRQHFDGDFYLFDPPRESPALSLVFVQSRDGNTVVPDPRLSAAVPLISI